jgi:hypothetical protein
MLNVVYGKPSKRRMSPIIILSVVIGWLILLSVPSYLEGTLFHSDGVYDIMSTANVTFAEDLFTISVIVSMGLILYFSLLSFDKFDRLFLRSDTISGQVETALPLEARVRYWNFVGHRTRVSLLLFSLLFIACLLQSVILVEGYIKNDNVDHNWNGPGSWAGLASLGLGLFLLLGVGPALGWRLLATTYLTWKIIGCRDCPFVIPNAVISTNDGIGQVFRLAALTAAIPLVTTPSLIVWLLTRGDLMIVYSIGSGAIIGVVALVAFIIPSSAVTAAVSRRKQNDIDSIDKLMSQYLESLRAAGSESIPKENLPLTTRMDSLMKWRDTRTKDPVWPYGWLAVFAMAVLTETVIAGLTSFL